MSDRDEFGAFLVGFIVGGLTGAVVSLLFAPQSGEETRALIKDKSIELRDNDNKNIADSVSGCAGLKQKKYCHAKQDQQNDCTNDHTDHDAFHLLILFARRGRFFRSELGSGLINFWR